MSQQVRIQFIGDANFKAVTAEINRLTAAMTAMGNAGALRGPQAMNAALTASMNTMSGNINAISGMQAGIVQLESASERFAKQLRTNAFETNRWRQAAVASLGVTNNFSKGLSGVAREQIRLRDANFTGFLQDINGRMTGVASTSNRLTDAFAIQRQQTMMARQALQAMGTQIVNTGKNMQWAGRQITVGLAMPLTIAAGAASMLAYNVDKQLTRIVKVYNFAGGATEEAMEDLRRASLETSRQIAEDFGIMESETLAVTAAFAQMGFEGQKLQEMTQLTMRTSLLGEVDTESSQRLVRSLTNAFEELNGQTGVASRTMEDVSVVLDRFNVVENETILSVQELASELPDLAGTLNAVGLSAENGAAFLTAMADSGLNVNESQTALRTSLVRTLSPTKRAIDTWRELAGIDLDGLIRGANGDTEKILMDISEIIVGLGDDTVTATRLLNTLYESRQSGRMLQLFRQMGNAANGIDNGFARATQTLGGFGNEAMSSLEAFQISQEELERQQESLAGRFDRTKATFASIATEIGMEVLPIFNAFLEMATNLIGFFNDLPNVIKRSVYGFAVLAAVIGPLIMTAGVLRNLFGSIIQFIAGRMIKSLASMGQSTEIVANVQDSLNRKMMSSRDIMIAQEKSLASLTTTMQAYQRQGAATLMNSYGAPLGSSRGATLSAEMKQNEIKQNALKNEATLTRSRIQSERLALRVSASALKTQEAKVKSIEKEIALQQKILDVDIDKLRMAHAIAIQRSQEADMALRVAQLKQQELSATASQSQVLAARLRVERATTAGVIAINNEAEARARVTAAINAQTKASANLADANSRQIKASTTLAQQQKNHEALTNRLITLEQKLIRINNHSADAHKNKARVLREIEQLNIRLANSAQLSEKAAEKQAVQLSRTQKALQMARGGVGTSVALGMGAAGTAIRSMADDGWVNNLGRGVQLSGAMLMNFAFMPAPLAIIVTAIEAFVFNSDIILELWNKIQGKVEDTSSYAQTFADSMNLRWEDPEQFEEVPSEELNRLEMRNRLYEENIELIEELQRARDEGTPQGQQRIDGLVQSLAIDLQQAGNETEDVIDYVEQILDAADVEMTVAIAADPSQVTDFIDMMQARLANTIGTQDSSLLLSEVNNMIGSLMNLDFEVGSAQFDTLSRNIGGRFEGMMEEIRAVSEEGYRILVEQGVDSVEELDLLFSNMENSRNLLGMYLGHEKELYEALDPTVQAMGESYNGLRQEMEFLADAEGLMVDALIESAEWLEQHLDGTESFSEAMGIFIENTGLGTSAQEAYAEALSFGRHRAELSGEALYEYAVSEAIAGADAEELAAAVEGVNEALEGQDEAALAAEEALQAAMQRGQQYVGFYKQAVQEMQKDFADAVTAAYDAETEARMDSYASQMDMMSDRHDRENEIMQDAHEEQRDIFNETYEQRREQMEADFDAREKAIEDARDLEVAALEEQIAALDVQQAAEDKLEERRKRIFEAEKRRRDYLAGQRNSAVSFTVALAEGNVGDAARIREEMRGSESDYVAGEADAKRQQELAESAEARKAEQDAIQGRITALEDAADIELALIQETRDASLQALEDEKEAREEMLQDRQEAEKDALKKSQELMQEELQARRDNYADMRAAWKDEFLGAALSDLQATVPRTAAEFQVLIDEFTNRIGPDGFGQSVVDAASEYQTTVRGGFTNAVEEAQSQMREAEQWQALGEHIGEAFGRAMTGDMSVAELLAEVERGTRPLRSGGGGGPGGPQEFHSGGAITGGHRHPGLKPDERMIKAQTGEFVMQRTAVQRLGMGNLQKLNSVGYKRQQTTGRDDHTFHSGGLIGAVAGMAARAASAAMGFVGTNLNALTPETVGKLDTRFGEILGRATGGSSSLGSFDAPNLNPEQDAIAATIWNVGQSVGANAKQMMAALMTGFVESRMRNLPYGDRDSLGVFQQRPSMDWGTAAQIMDPAYAARSFFLGHGTNKGALFVDQSGTAGQIAQRVQRSAFGSRYDEFGAQSQQVLDAIQAAGGGVLEGGMASSLGGPFSGLFGGYGSGLRAPDQFSSWLTANQRRVNAGVMSVVGQVLSSVPGGQDIISGYRPGSIVAGSNGRLSNHAQGHAVDIGALALSYPGGTAQSDAMGDEIAAKFRALPAKYGVSEVLWKTMTGGNHFNHVHVGFRNGVPGFPTGPAPMMPQLATGGNIKYDNTIANLHKGETVLTAPLSARLEEGINRMSSGSGTVINQHIYPSAGMDETDLAKKVIRMQENAKIKRGARPSGG